MSESSAYVSNNELWPITDSGAFHISQRNVGFADNDARWTVTQLPEMYWTNYGVLRKKRSSRFLGVYDTQSEAMAAVAVAEIMPLEDTMVY